jgi:hypothetical protein
VNTLTEENIDKNFILIQMKEEIDKLEKREFELIDEINKIRVKLKDKKKAFSMWSGKKIKKDKKKEETPVNQNNNVPIPA